MISEDTKEFQDALDYVRTLKARGGKPVPADENGLEALVEKNMHNGSSSSVKSDETLGCFVEKAYLCNIKC